LTVYDVLGRRVAVLADELQTMGEHFASWNGLGGEGKRLPSGIYFMSLEYGGMRTTSRVLLIR
jgi:hypothetical protein